MTRTIELTKDHQKSNGKVIKAGTILDCYGELPFKDGSYKEVTRPKATKK